VQRYDKEYSGREITMDVLYINVFTGNIYIKNLKVLEQNSDSIFISTKSLSINFSILKLLSKTIEISELTINKPFGIIIQNKNGFNFDDLKKRFSPKKTKLQASEFKVKILQVHIKNGELHYRENLHPVSYFIKDLTIESIGKQRSDSSAFQFSLSSGTGSGNIKGEISVNLNTFDYRLDINVKNFDLKVLHPYIKDFMNYGYFSAFLDADMKSLGNIKDQKKITNKGTIVISDFHLGKTAQNDYLSFDNFSMFIREMSPQKFIYNYDSISLNRLYLKYELYDKMNNLETIFGKKWANIEAVQANTEKFNLIIEIANYLKTLSENFPKSDFQINHIALNNANLKFNDYTGSEKFALNLHPLSVRADSIYRQHKRVQVTFRSTVKPYGKISATLSINPKNTTDFDLQYKIIELPVCMFNPYLISHTSYPLNNGTLQLKGEWNVRNGKIRSNNHLLIEQPVIANRILSDDAKWLPLWAPMVFVDNGDKVVNYIIPISGKLKNLKFQFATLFSDLIKSIVSNPATTKYKPHTTAKKPDKLTFIPLNWEMRKSEIASNQQSFLKEMANFLKHNPQANIVIHPQLYAIKEQESILLFEAKKKYFVQSHLQKSDTINAGNILTIEKMSIREASFTRFLNNYSKNTLKFSIQDKCALIIQQSFINNKIEQLNQLRKSEFLSIFEEKGVQNQVKFSKTETVIPFNGFSFYKIVFNEQYQDQFFKNIIK
jgi:hypothetical protein